MLRPVGVRLCSCGESRTFRETSITVRAALACLVVVASPIPGTAQSERWTLERTIMIGSALDPDAGLSQVGNVLVDGDRLLVAQPLEQRVRIFSTEGDFLGFKGRQGEGPGEFEWVSGMGLRDELVWVHDEVLRRVQHFDDEGRLVSSVRIRGHPTLPVNSPRVRAVLPDGSMIVGHARSVVEIAAFPDRPDLLLRFDSEGLPYDTAAILTGRDTQVKLPREGRSVAYLSLPGSSRSLFESAPDGSGFVVVHRETASGDEPHTYRVIRFDARADTAWARDFRYDPIPVSAAWRARELKAEAQGENARARRILERAYDALKFLPPIEDVEVGADGSTWLLVRTGTDSFEWEVLDPSGHPLARVAPIPRGGLRWAGADSLWFLEHDELDVPYLVRYAVHRRPVGR